MDEPRELEEAEEGQQVILTDGDYNVPKSDGTGTVSMSPGETVTVTSKKKLAEEGLIEVQIVTNYSDLVGVKVLVPSTWKWVPDDQTDTD